MALFYLETSALVKLYVYEAGTDRLLDLTASDLGHRFAILSLAQALIDSYPLRAYDAAQLAGYLTLRSISGAEEPIFVCSDKVLLSAARNEGCPTLDPSSPA